MSTIVDIRLLKVKFSGIDHGVTFAFIGCDSIQFDRAICSHGEHTVRTNFFFALSAAQVIG